MGFYDKTRFLKEEQNRFFPGKKSIRLFNYKKINFAVQVCLDIIDPVPLSKLVKKQEIDFLFVPSTFSIDYLYSIGKARSLENQTIVVITNRTQDNNHIIKYLGKSGMFFPDGTEIRLSENEESLRIISFEIEDLIQNRIKRKILQISN